MKADESSITLEQPIAAPSELRYGLKRRKSGTEEKARQMTEDKKTTPGCTNGPAWPQVIEVLKKHHHQPDIMAARALYSAVAAHRLVGAPVWPMLVAPPGSLKTELLNALMGLPRVHMIDQVTPRTFISGQIEEPGKPKQGPPSLLHRIGPDGIIAYPDFSTILAMNADKKAQVLADMRRIYDGKLRKEFGTAENPQQHEWTGRITFLVAVTVAIDGYYSVFSTLGERYVMIRWPRAGGIEAGLAAMNQERKEVTEEVRAAVHALLGDLPNLEPTLPDQLQVRIAALSEVVVRARTHVPRDSYSKNIIYVPEPESNTRLAQQLAQLSKGSAILDCRGEADEADFQLVGRVAFDCMPPVRAAILKALIAGQPLKTLNVPDSTLAYAKQDLKAQDLLVSEGADALSALAQEMLETAGLLKPRDKAA